MSFTGFFLSFLAREDDEVRACSACRPSEGRKYYLRRRSSRTCLLGTYRYTRVRLGRVVAGALRRTMSRVGELVRGAHARESLKYVLRTGIFFTRRRGKNGTKQNK